MEIINKRIGILGGSFDPIHIGHLILAKQAQQMYNLDKVIFIPCNKSVNKNPVASQMHRYEMIKKCLFYDNKNASFKCSVIDIKRSGITYTIDTLNELKITYPNDTLYLILGWDQINNIQYWKNWWEICKNYYVLFNFPCNKNDKINIRSTIIRKYVKKGISIKYLVTPSVEKYIYDNHLYKEKL